MSPEILLTDRRRGWRWVGLVVVLCALFLAGCTVRVEDARGKDEKLTRIEQRLTGIEERQKGMAAVLNQLPRNPQAKPETQTIRPK